MSHSGNGWKGAEAINHRNATFSSLNSQLWPQFSVIHLESSAEETRFHPFRCPVTGEDKHQGHTGPCCGTQCSTRGCPRHRPRRMTLPVSHLAPAQPVKQWQRKSPFLSSQRTVPPGWQGDGEHWSGISLNRRKERGRRHCGLEKKKKKKQGLKRATATLVIQQASQNLRKTTKESVSARLHLAHYGG